MSTDIVLPTSSELATAEQRIAEQSPELERDYGKLRFSVFHST